MGPGLGNRSRERNAVSWMRRREVQQVSATSSASSFTCLLKLDPIVSYLKNRAKQIRVFTPEFTIAFCVTLAFLFGTYFLLPYLQWFQWFSRRFRMTGMAGGMRELDSEMLRIIDRWLPETVTSGTPSRRAEASVTRPSPSPWVIDRSIDSRSSMTGPALWGNRSFRE